MGPIINLISPTINIGMIVKSMHLLHTITIGKEGSYSLIARELLYVNYYFNLIYTYMTCHIFFHSMKLYFLKLLSVLLMYISITKIKLIKIIC